MIDYEPLWEALRSHGNLSKACRDLDMVRTTFLDHIAADPHLADKYAREKQYGIDAMMEEQLDAPIEDPAKARLEWDRKRWHASKLYAKKYGDKLALGGAEDLPAIKTETTVPKLERLLAAGLTEEAALRLLAGPE